MSTTTLCEDDIKEVKDFLYEIRLKWYDFGIELEVKTGELDVIKSKYRDEPGSCLRETLKERLRFPDNPLTWSAIAKALNAKAINEVALATKAAEKTEIVEGGSCRDEHTLLGNVRKRKDIPIVEAEEGSRKQLRLVSLEGAPEIYSPSADEKRSQTHLDPKVHKDLEHQLKLEQKWVKNRYASFVSCLCNCLEVKRVKVVDLRTFILCLPTFKHDPMKKLEDPLSDVKDKLQGADTINKIIDLLIGHNCVSFVHYDIFESILENFCSDIKHEKLNYAECLKCYVKKLKISELAMIIPEMKGTEIDTSKTLSLKVDTSLNSEFTTIVELESFVAEILGIMPSQLQLLTIDKGCVIVTFLLPAVITVIDQFKTLTDKQRKVLESLSVLWLKYYHGTYTLDFRHKDVTTEVLTTKSNHNTEFFTAVLQENTHNVRRMLNEMSIDVNSRHQHNDHGGWTALMIACSKGSYDLTELLLQKGAEVDLQDDQRWSALKRACSGKDPIKIDNYAKIVRLLLERDAQVDLQDEYGWSALMNASKLEGHLEITKLLIKNGANVNLQRISGRTALMSACETGQYEAAELLLAHRAQVNLQDNDGRTALMYASYGGHSQLVKLLIDQGAIVNAIGKDGQTPLIKASQEGQFEIVICLLERNAQVNTRDSNGWSALMYAVKRGRIEVVEVLLSKGADIHAQSFKLDSPTSLALALGPEHHKLTTLLKNLRKKESRTSSAMTLAELVGHYSRKQTVPKTSSETSMQHSSNPLPTLDELRGPNPHIASAAAPLRTELPLEIRTLVLIKWENPDGNVENFCLIDEVNTKWERFGLLLNQTQKRLEGFKLQHHENPTDCFCRVMDQWLADDGTPEYPATWAGVVKLLQDANESEVAEVMKVAVTSAIMPTPPQATS